MTEPGFREGVRGWIPLPGWGVWSLMERGREGWIRCLKVEQRRQNRLLTSVCSRSRLLCLPVFLRHFLVPNTEVDYE